MSLPSISLRRTFLIARRDYLGYVKTWGFWISFFLPFVFGILGFLASSADLSVQPVRYETILDDTGQHESALIQKYENDRARLAASMMTEVGSMTLSKDEVDTLRDIVEAEGVEAGKAYLNSKVPGMGDRFDPPESKTRFVKTPESSLEALRPYLRGDQLIDVDGTSMKLNGVLHVYENDGLKADYWSSNINNNTVKDLARGYFRDSATQKYLQSGGLSAEGLREANRGVIRIDSFDPSKAATGPDASQVVTMADKVPYIVAGIMAGALWLTVFAGSYMLLTSMLEEKLNKLLEMMLASTRFSEIMFGKLLGAAALTITAMAPYIILGIVGVIGLYFTADPEIVAGLTAAFSAKMIIFFFIYLILGYVFYGAFFIALGALAESAQDAQTLTTPIMLILTVCVMVVPIGMNSPDSPIIEWASWFPLSAPFAAIIKLASDPPIWELALSAFFLFLCVVGVVWLASQVFRFGVLSGSGVKAGFGNLKSSFVESRTKRKAIKNMPQ